MDKDKKSEKVLSCQKTCDKIERNGQKKETYRVGKMFIYHMYGYSSLIICKRIKNVPSVDDKALVSYNTRYVKE